MKDKYLEECAVIQQNCTYTAETHYRMAVSAKNKAFWFEVVPAVTAALSGTLVASGIADVNLLPVTILSASVSAAAGVFNPNKRYQDHLAAANSFTSLKHDARFLKDARSTSLTDEAFAIAVENLHSRYGELIQATPPTNSEVFMQAREVVQQGLHEPDRDSEGKVR